jgi:GTP pyrophosphokinase
VGAKVNGALVPLRYHLQNGDIVEIMTSKTQRPRVDWLDFVVTGRARTRIRQKLREHEELPQTAAPSGPGESRSVAPPQIVKIRPKVEPVDEATREKLVRIAGGQGMALQFAKCCNAMPGEGIIGFVTRRHLITIHRADCRFLEAAERESERLISASWQGDEPPAVGVRVVIASRPNGLSDITAALRPMNLDISRAEYRPGENGDSVFECVFACPDRHRFERVVKALGQIYGVRRVDEVPAEEPAHAG